MNIQPGRVQARPNLQGVDSVAGTGAVGIGVWVDGVLAVPIMEHSENGELGMKGVCLVNVPFTKLGLTWPSVQCLSLQSFPLGQNSVLNTTPLSTVATGDGWENLHCGLVHLRAYLHREGVPGRSGPDIKGAGGARGAERGAGGGVGAGSGWAETAN